MARINLLPWRAELRKQKQSEFLALALFIAIVSGFVIFLVHSYMTGLIDYQNARNQYLRNEITLLDHKIAKIKTLDATKKALLNRMKIVEQLQASRPGVVHLFDQLVTTEPPGLYLTSFVQKGNTIALAGRADSNARVSTYMRQLDASPWFANAKLDLIVTKSTEIGKVSDFNLTVQQTMPSTKGHADKKGP
ncbi:PilN domain-containing protein [Acidihalobacter prosperus]|uniref:Type IV pilus biogenesis protein PilN n=1 Tax=Acidihalobacter prosperus TaxID=160660 RepID=A0A1A6C0X8_9GAMM|nr:PilN domain-containing protein [Acidihalobacter prosperus]OBS08216.1 Type IV pilus biogenesis protein PilN [Acidihalobacter prosperus]